MSSQRRRLDRKQAIGLAGVGVLAVATAAVVAMASIPQPSASVAPAGIESKASAYQQEVKDKMAAQNAAYEESRRVHVPFPADRPLRLLYVGDSLSDGHSASKVVNGFRPTFTAEIAKRGAVEEYRSEVLTTELKMAGNVVSVPSDMDAVIVQLGTNDAGGDGRTAIPKFTTDYEALLTNIKSTSPSAAMVCLGTWRPPGTAETYDDVIAATCERHRGKYIDLTELYGNPSNRGPAGMPAESGGISDNAHPNDTGYRAIRDVLLDRLVIG